MPFSVYTLYRLWTGVNDTPNLKQLWRCNLDRLVGWTNIHILHGGREFVFHLTHHRSGVQKGIRCIKKLAAPIKGPRRSSNLGDCDVRQILFQSLMTYFRMFFFEWFLLKQAIFLSVFSLWDLKWQTVVIVVIMVHSNWLLVHKDDCYTCRFYNALEYGIMRRPKALSMI